MDNHIFKKRFGQNFLRSTKIAGKFIDNLDINIKSVIEIGPGHGIITEQLLKNNFEVYAVEIDESLYLFLEDKFNNFDNFHLIKTDILEFRITDFLIKKGEANNKSNKIYSVVGSLPYNISKKIVNIFLTQELSPKEMIFMLQKEVAEDYVAKAPSATFLSNMVSLYGKCIYLGTVKKEEFHPTPKVDGGIIKITLNNDKPDLNLVKFIRNGFRTPRKTLINNLSGIYHYDKSILFNIFQKHQININARPAELQLNQWQAIYNEVV